MKEIDDRKAVLISNEAHEKLKKYCVENKKKMARLVESLIDKEIKVNENRQKDNG